MNTQTNTSFPPITRHKMAVPFPNMNLKFILVVQRGMPREWGVKHRMITLESTETNEFGVRVEEIDGSIDPATMTIRIVSRDLTAEEIGRIKKTGDVGVPFEIVL
jgi:hypothetical protein